MTNEDKQLLLKALCGYFPYGLKSIVVKFDDNDGSEYYTDCEIIGIRRNQLVEFIRLQDNKEIGRSDWYDISWFKPYLRPMSSMTEEEYECFVNVLKRSMVCRKCYDWHEQWIQSPSVEEWLNENHFDYRLLIEKGLALEAPEGMYND